MPELLHARPHAPAPQPPEHADPTALIAALFPTDLAAAQALLAAEAARALALAGHDASVGSYGEHASADTRLAGATSTTTVVLVPMAELWDLDASDPSDRTDPGVWHLLAREPGGRWLEPDLRGYGCPGVLWANRAGIDPTVAPALLSSALANPAVAAVLGLDPMLMRRGW